jgi:hypothetical protein
MECYICLKEDNNVNYEIECSHKFHRQCIKTWFKKKFNCPVCRKKITSHTRLTVLNVKTMETLDKTLKTVDLITENHIDNFENKNVYNHGKLIVDNCLYFYPTNSKYFPIKNHYMIMISYNEEIADINASFDTKTMPYEMKKKINFTSLNTIMDSIITLIKLSFQ